MSGTTTVVCDQALHGPALWFVEASCAALAFFVGLAVLTVVVEAIHDWKR